MSLLLILTFFLFQVGNGVAQIDTVRMFSMCESYNKFLNTSGFDSLLQYAEEITPSGIISFQPSAIQDLDSIQQLYPFLEIQSACTFEKGFAWRNRLDSNLYSIRYQQFYNGVKVEGGGYTLQIPGPDLVHPCMKLYSLFPYIASDITISTTPNIVAQDLDSLVNLHLGGSLVSTQVDTYELRILPNGDYECGYVLVWHVIFFDEGWRLAYIDAHSGDVILHTDYVDFKNAPTINYDVQNMDDSDIGNQTFLISTNNQVYTYDYDKQDYPPQFPYNENLIPSIPVSKNEWTDSDADESVFQAHWCVKKSIEFYEDIGIIFNKVHVAANLSSPNPSITAGVYRASELKGDTYIFLDECHLDNGTYALFDAIGHELGHVFLYEHLNPVPISTLSLHEAIADVFGIYIESRWTNMINWEMSDEVECFIRDLSDPDWDCYEDVKSFLCKGCQHVRSIPLGYWFYLITNGDVGLNIPSLGFETAFGILLDALPGIDFNADYPQLMDKTLWITKNKFGRCSPEFYSVTRAWEKICVPTGYANQQGEIVECELYFDGPYNVCEESHSIEICVEGGPSEADYRFYILGPNAASFVASGQGVQTGNVIEGGRCLYITEFPKYPYYPRLIAIEAIRPGVGGVSLKRRINLIDCNYDDPTCEEYYGTSGLISSIEVTDGEYADQADAPPYYVKIFDVLGRELYRGLYDNTFVKDSQLMISGRFVFAQYFSEGWAYIRTEKLFIQF
jgi:Zn-dependent metalloprotease